MTSSARRGTSLPFGKRIQIVSTISRLGSWIGDGVLSCMNDLAFKSGLWIEDTRTDGRRGTVATVDRPARVGRGAGRGVACRLELAPAFRNRPKIHQRNRTRTPSLATFSSASRPLVSIATIASRRVTIADVSAGFSASSAPTRR